MTAGALTPEEIAFWSLWKGASEAVWGRVERDIAAESGLSAPDFSVLSRLEESAAGSLKQQALADAIGWSKSRLSHHLTRMQERGLVVRTTPDGSGVVVTLTATGRERIALARPVHTAAVRRHLLARLTPDERAVFAAFAARLTVEEG